MAQCTREQVDRWNAKLSNGFRLDLERFISLWTPSSTPGMWCSRGLGAVVKITDNIYQKRNWNELAKFTAEWDEKRLLEEAKKHMAELQNDVVA